VRGGEGVAGYYLGREGWLTQVGGMSARMRVLGGSKVLADGSRILANSTRKRRVEEGWTEFSGKLLIFSQR